MVGDRIVAVIRCKDCIIGVRKLRARSCRNKNVTEGKKISRRHFICVGSSHNAEGGAGSLLFRVFLIGAGGFSCKLLELEHRRRFGRFGHDREKVMVSGLGIGGGGGW